jgi:hypothetical protein
VANPVGYLAHLEMIIDSEIRTEDQPGAAFSDRPLGVLGQVAFQYQPGGFYLPRTAQSRLLNAYQISNVRINLENGIFSFQQLLAHNNR